MPTIGDVCNREVIAVTRETTVLAAARCLRERHVGSVVVCKDLDEDRRVPIGIVTDRDIVVEVVATELRAEIITVGDIMVRELVTAHESDGVADILDVMRHKGVRRIPVVAGNGQLVGIVSLDDLLGHLAAQLTDIARTVVPSVSTEPRPGSGGRSDSRHKRG
jgi:CBS domain-containing protein